MHKVVGLLILATTEAGLNCRGSLNKLGPQTSQPGPARIPADM